MMTKKICILCAAAAALATSCNTREQAPEVKRAVMNTVSIAVSDSTWTYFSLESGRTVGTSPLGDPEADAQWAARKDWDLALCSDMLKTNGGTSGSGKGAVQAVTRQNFNALEQAPQSGYTEDRNDIILRR